MLVITAGDPQQVLTNLMTMLHPGDHLQWIERDLHAAKVIPANPSVRSNGSGATLRQLQSFRDFGWVSNLAPLLQESGFVNVSAKSHRVPDELQMVW